MGSPAADFARRDCTKPLFLPNGRHISAPKVGSGAGFGGSLGKGWKQVEGHTDREPQAAQSQPFCQPRHFTDLNRAGKSADSDQEYHSPQGHLQSAGKGGVAKWKTARVSLGSRIELVVNIQGLFL